MRLEELICARKVLAYSARTGDSGPWEDLCRKIKREHEGRYPRDWFDKVVRFFDDKSIPHVELSDIGQTSLTI